MASPLILRVEALSQIEANLRPNLALVLSPLFINAANLFKLQDNLIHAQTFRNHKFLSPKYLIKPRSFKNMIEI
jgi:hypothetical protein